MTIQNCTKFQIYRFEFPLEYGEHYELMLKVMDNHGGGSDNFIGKAILPIHHELLGEWKLPLESDPDEETNYEYAQGTIKVQVDWATLDAKPPGKKQTPYAGKLPCITANHVLVRYFWIFFINL